MAQGHTRPGKTHDHPDLLPLLFFITMHGAECTGRFFLTVRAFFESLGRIAQQVFAAGARLAFIGDMVMGAIDFRHAAKGCMFAFQPAGELSYVFRTR